MRYKTKASIITSVLTYMIIAPCFSISFETELSPKAKVYLTFKPGGDNVSSCEGLEGIKVPHRLEQFTEHGYSNAYFDNACSVVSMTEVIQAVHLTTQLASHHSTLVVSFSNFKKFDFDNMSITLEEGSNADRGGLPRSVVGVAFIADTQPDCRKNFNLTLKPDFFQDVKESLPLLPIGFGFNADSVGCKHLAPHLHGADFVVVRASLVAHVRFPESFGLFSAWMGDTDKKIRAFLAETNPRLKVMYHLKLDLYNKNNKNQSLADSDKQYILLLDEYAKRWSSVSAPGTSVILDLPQNQVLVGPETNNSSNNSVRQDASHRSSIIIPSFHNAATATGLNESLPLYFSTISTTFRTLHLTHSIVGTITSAWISLAESWTRQTRLSHPLNIILEIDGWAGVTDLKRIVDQLLVLSSQNVHLKVVEFSRRHLSESEMLERIYHLKELGLGIGCLVSIDRNWTAHQIVENTRRSCGRDLFYNDRVTHFTWHRPHAGETETNDKYFSFGYYMEHYQKELHILLEARAELVKAKPGATVVVKFGTEHNHWRDYPQFRNRITRNFYCHQEILGMNSYFEALINWGRIHNFPILLKESFETEEGFGWWSRIEPGESLVPEVTRVPSFAMTNFPQNLTSWKADPCVIWSVDCPQNGIPFRNFAGVTVSMQIKEVALTTEELQMLLLFSLNKFQTLEVVLGQNQLDDVSLLEKALSPKFMNILETNGIRGRKVFVELKLTTATPHNSEILSEIEKLGTTASNLNPSLIRLEGIHIDTNGSRKDALHFMDNLKTKGTFKIGLSVPNCGKLLNSFARSRRTQPVYSSANYILCQSATLQARNSDELQFARDMEALLYLKSAIARFSPDITVMFRLNSDACCEADQSNRKTRNMLRFLNDVNQVADGNKIMFFLVQAFVPSNNRLSSSWWRIDDYQDLTNVSVFFDREAEFQKNDTWRPTLPKDAGTGPIHIDWLHYTLGFLGIFTLLLFVVTSIILVTNSKRPLLSEFEVQEFMDGAPTSKLKLWKPTTAAGENSYASSKFEDRFSLEKADVKFDDEKEPLGTGNFGMVLSAVVRGRDVAVKVPHDGCSKECFLSMLTEVKVMAHVGNHDNVVTFIGAYINEINKGKIYIVTQLCENGSLLSHLRKHRQPGNVGGQLEDRPNKFKPALIKFSLEVASGMEYIASKNVVHGDLSTRNVLLTADSTCKISDFGLSRKLYEYNKYVKKSQEPLPWRWMAHESLTTMEFTTKSDVWSYGVTLWEIFTFGDTPYPGMSWTINFADQVRTGLRLAKPEFSNSEIYNVMLTCWRLDPTLRPTFTSLKKLMQMSIDYNT